jgi:hypothetical protein
MKRRMLIIPLMLLLILVSPFPAGGQHILLQGGFSEGSVRSSGSSWFLEQSSGVTFGGIVAGGSYLEAGGFYPIGQTTTGVELPHDMIDASPARPKVLTLCSPYPNPGRAGTLRFGLPTTSRVSLRIFNILGQQVTTLVDGVRPAGWYAVTWNARDHASRPVSSGAYIIRFTADNMSFTKRMMVIR